MKADQELKRKITERWRILAENVWNTHVESSAFAQLEYILQEAGLLSQRKERKNKKEIKPND